jgi:uncharacterized protein YggU (UPF0235/DUF167 family)
MISIISTVSLFFEMFFLMNVIYIKCKVNTGTSQQTIIWDQSLNIFKVYIREQREKGKANNAICELIAEKLQLPKRSVIVNKGVSTPLKEIAIMAPYSKDEVYRILQRII